MIAAHQTMLAPQGAPSSLDYVQDGLYYHLDGIENAGRGVHSSTATTWTDLTGNGRDGSFINAASGLVWQDDAAYLYGKTHDGMAKIAGLPSMTAFSFEIVFKGGTAEDYARIWDTEAYFGGTEGKRFDGLVYTAAYANPSFAICSNSDLNFSSVPACYGMSNPMSLSVYPTASGTTITKSNACVNGSFVQAVSDSKSSRTPASYIDVANRSNSPNRGIDMAVFAIRVYNRVLTASEIAANYAIDKARFNLP